jgi:hypothetical protein
MKLAWEAYIESEVFFVEAWRLQGNEVIDRHLSSKEDREVAHVFIEDSLKGRIWLRWDVIDDWKYGAAELVVLSIIIH